MTTVTYLTREQSMEYAARQQAAFEASWYAQYQAADYIGRSHMDHARVHAATGSPLWHLNAHLRAAAAIAKAVRTLAA